MLNQLFEKDSAIFDRDPLVAATISRLRKNVEFDLENESSS